MREIIESIEGEYRRYRALGERTMDQLSAEQLVARPSEESNSIATLVWHISGNLESRFTDFLTTDGEKPWRERDDEFVVRNATPGELRAKWNRGWDVLMDTLATLNDDDLSGVVTIRGVELSVSDALLRSVAHTASHVGQMTYQGKVLAGGDWEWLSIAPGGTAAYNQNPTREKG
ncbi:MAG: DUF1572 family protein [Gemmatimonadetes bacterium]|nr:DUF1572 domain-containing protein [Gemmatimonadota bacterium]NNF13622.1 DUF1572 family protein [Gemmatimonadota bacterium]